MNEKQSNSNIANLIMNSKKEKSLSNIWMNGIAKVKRIVGNDIILELQMLNDLFQENPCVISVNKNLNSNIWFNIDEGDLLYLGQSSNNPNEQANQELNYSNEINIGNVFIQGKINAIQDLNLKSLESIKLTTKNSILDLSGDLNIKANNIIGDIQKLKLGNASGELMDILDKISVLLSNMITATFPTPQNGSSSLLLGDPTLPSKQGEIALAIASLKG